MTRALKLWILLLLAIGSLPACSDDDDDDVTPTDDDDDTTPSDDDDDDDTTAPNEGTLGIGDGLRLDMQGEPLRLELIMDDEVVLASTAKAGGLPAPIQLGYWKPGANETGNLFADPHSIPVDREGIELIEWVDLDAGEIGVDDSCDAWSDCMAIVYRIHATIQRDGQAIEGSVSVDAAGSPPSSARLRVSGFESDPPVLVRFNFMRGAEGIWGGGEIHDRANLAGSRHPIFFTIDLNSESSLNERHVPVPFFTSSAGYGLWLNMLQPSAFDASNPGVTSVTVNADHAELWMMAETSPWASYREYIRQTGKPMVPPKWAFAPMQWRDEHNGPHEILEDMEAIRANDIPGSLIWLDNPYQTAYNSFEFSPTFPNMGEVIQTLNDEGFAFMLWSTPYIDSDDPVLADAFSEGDEKKYFVKNPQGNTQLVPFNDAGGGVGMIDWTFPEAVTWYKENFIKKMVRMGTEGFKLDYGEEIVPALGPIVLQFRFHDGSDQTTMHMIRSNLYARTYKEAIEEEGYEPFLLTRAGGMGGQIDTPCIWPGDLDNDFTFFGPKEDGEINVGGLPAAINDAISLSMSGFPNFGSDIGGYRNGQPSKEVLIRWAQFQAVLPVMQLGGNDPHHNPWDFTRYDQETLDIYRVYAKLHTSLFPYLYNLSANADQAPLVRPVGLQFPDDPAAVEADYEFMVGDDLLVAPIYAGGFSREVHFPEGEWVNWFDPEEVIEGPLTVTREVALDQLPLFVRKGATIPTIPEDVDTLRPTINPDTVYWDPERTDFIFKQF